MSSCVKDILLFTGFTSSDSVGIEVTGKAGKRRGLDVKEREMTRPLRTFVGIFSFVQ